MTKDSTIDIVNQTLEIATLPQITMRIIEVVQDPQSTAHDLHKIVANDPALSARVLRVVNSAFYGLPGQIGSIDRAIMLLGLNAVKNIAVAASLTKMFKDGVVCDDFTGADLWTHSVAVGATNKLITTEMGMALPDEAFLAGLIHDLGLVAIMQIHSEKLAEVVGLVKSGVTFRAAEERVLGTNHETVGKALTEQWKFPRSFQYVAGYHHCPMELAAENRSLAVVTCISDILCSNRSLGLSVTVDDNEVPDNLVTEIGLTNEHISEINDRIEEELEVVRALVE